VGKLSRPRAQWLHVGVVAVGLGAATAAGQGLAIASPADSPDPGGVNSTSDSVSGTGSTAPADVSASRDDQSAAGTAADTQPTTAESDSSQESTTTSLGGGPTSTLSAQQNSSQGGEPSDGSDAESGIASTAQDKQDRITQPVASGDVDENPPDFDSAAVNPDRADIADATSAVRNDHDVADTAAEAPRGASAGKLPSVATTLADGDGKASYRVANAETGVDDNVEGTAPTAQTASSAVNAYPTQPLDLPPNPVRTLVAAFLGLFGFNPDATGPSSNPLNPFLDLAWGLYRRIETTIAETVYTVFGIKLITTTVPTTDTGIDLLGNTRDLNVVWVDGQGFVGYQLMDTTRSIAIYQTTSYTTVDGILYPTNPPGNVVVKGPSAWDPSAVSAYANVVIVYDFYENTLYHTSFDDNGAAIRITVVSNALNNAYWYRTYRQFVFGHDFEAALDVVAHEYTHAVMDAVVGSQNGGLILGQNGESRALEEAYADIMGSLIEGKSGADEWLLGEDYGCGAPSASTGCAIRNLADPSEFGDPENYSNYNNNADEHFNSTIFSFAAFKMMTDSQTSGISRDTWADVYYHSLYELPAGASFADARAAVIASAVILGFTEDQLQAVRAAFEAVGIMPSVLV
jgi:hypothetical protein